MWKGDTARSVKTEQSLLALNSKTKSHSSVRAGEHPPRGGSLGKRAGLVKMEQDYEEGLKKYDRKTEEIKRLIDTKSGEFHSKVRSSFITRKHVNDNTDSQFHTLTRTNRQ